MTSTLVNELIVASELTIFHNEDDEPVDDESMRAQLERVEGLLMEAAHAIWRMGLHESVVHKLAKARALEVQFGLLLRLSTAHIELTEDELACLASVINFYKEPQT